MLPNFKSLIIIVNHALKINEKEYYFNRFNNSSEILMGHTFLVISFVIFLFII